MDENIKNLARAKAREMFAQSKSFQALEKAEQLSLYKEVVDSEYNKLAKAQGLATEMAKSPQAKDLLPDKEVYKNDRIDNAGRDLSSVVKEVDFPKFVSDLLEGVFNANLEVTLKQMESYQELLKSATASLSKFVQDVSDVDTYSDLADRSNGEFKFHMSNDGDVSEGSVVLTDKEGNKVDTEDAKIKSMIMDSQIAIAKERRALLRETILMGVSRLVVEKGTIKAGVLFDFKASETMTRSDSANSTTQNTTLTRRGGGFRRLWGGRRSVGIEKNTSITVSSSQGAQDSQVAAKLSGNVEIVFKSDYFKLDNFAKMYGNISEEEKEEAKK